MTVDRITLILTEDCNFSCTYCYIQPRKAYMPWDTARTLLNYLLLDKTSSGFNLYFNGGEPLLNYGIIKQSVEYVEKRKNLGSRIRYALSTNGALITRRILDFFSRHFFQLELSFDGLAQDISRNKGSFDHTRKLISQILKYPNIQLFVNSVFIPPTAGLLPPSVKLILDLGVKQYNFSTCLTVEWSPEDLNNLKIQLEKVQDIIIDHFRATGEMPVDTLKFQEKEAIWRCPAGESQICITPAGEVWGCQLFYELSKRYRHEQPYREYSLGSAGDFFTRRGTALEKVLKEYAKYSIDYFCKTDSLCFGCAQKTRCSICPAVAAYSSGELGSVPDFMCEASKILQAAKAGLKKKLDSLA